MTTTASISAALTAMRTFDGQPSIASLRDLISRSTDVSFADGTGDGQADLVYRDASSIAASANADYDLVGGVNDPTGAAISFATIKVIWIRNPSATGSVSFKPGAASAWVGLLAAGSEVIIPAKGVMLVVVESGSGIPISAGADTIRLTNNDGSNAVVPELVIIGTSV